jgi:hypothetical protein
LAVLYRFLGAEVEEVLGTGNDEAG